MSPLRLILSLVLLGTLPVFAAPPAAEQEQAFTALVERVQKNPGLVAPEDVVRMLQLSHQLNRPYAASLAIRVYLAQTPNVAPALLRLAAENAELAGDLRAAAARYRQYLRAAPSGPEASEAAGRFYRIQIDFLGAGDDAYRFMSEFGEPLRQSLAARRYDHWYLTTARERKDVPAVARWLATVFSDKLPLEIERRWYWEHLEWLLSEINLALPEHYEALPHCRRLGPLIRNSPRLMAKFQFYTAHLAFKAGAAGKEAAALEKDFAAVATAGRAYLDAVPTLETARDIFAVLSGGFQRYNDAEANRQLAPKRDLYVYAFGKLADADREQFMQDRWASPAQWIELGSQNAVLFRRAPGTVTLSFITQTNDLAVFQKQTEFLQGVRADRAAVINSLAVGGDLWGSVQHLIQKETWHLPFTAPTTLLAQQIWPVFAGFPRADAQKLPADYFPKLMARYGAELVAKSPIALFHPDAARDYLLNAWRTGDKPQLPTHLRALDWVPYTDDQRRAVFGPVQAEFRPWAEQLRRVLDEAKRVEAAAAKALTTAQAAKNEKQIPDLTKAAADATAKVKAAETAAAPVAPLEEALKQALESRLPDPAKAPTPLCQNLVKATLAIRAKNLPAYTEAVRALYAQVRDYDSKRTPYGAATLAYCMTHRPEFDTFDLHCELLADQLTRYAPNTPNRELTEVLNALMISRPGWNWASLPAADKARSLKINDIIAKATLANLAKNQFYPDLFQWLRQTRRGAGWIEGAANTDVLEKMIEQKVLLKSPTRYNAASGTVSYQWLLRHEFPGAAKKFPVETALDDLFVEEVRQTKFVDTGFWSYSTDAQRKGANVAAQVLAEFAKYPYGYENDQPVYSRPAFEEAIQRALNAGPAERAAFLTKSESYFGTTRVDGVATGYFSLLDQADVNTPAGRQQWFAKLKTFLDRGQTLAARYPAPHSVQLSRLTPPQLTTDELNTLLRIFTVCQPQLWSGGAGFETLATAAYDNLRREKREGELFALLPSFWKIAKDTGNGWFQRQVAAWGLALGNQGFNDLAAALATLGLDLLGGTVPEDLRNTLLALRSKALSSIGSFIPVERADRRYPLYAAQNAYLSGKPENAWELYQGSRDLVTGMFKELDPMFLIWIVERQTELARFDEAEPMARQLIQWVDAAPQNFDPEVRARLLLAFAGIAYARQEYPRARAQFEQIGIAKEFEGTLARRQAELRVAEVDRLTRNYEPAIERLEKLVQRKDAFLQAEGNYLLALIKFDQEQYPESRTYLDQVFAVEPSHANARILEGKLYLQLKKLIEATEVKVGLSASQRTIVPGRPLKVQLEDRNLAIVGKAANIEIRAWTESGDEEIFTLLPFGDSKTKFEGQIPTALAAPKKGDRTLQVRGGDIVRYDFSDRFKQANKITAAESVAIAVVSEAELYVSSGKIFTREEQEQAALEQAIRARVGVSAEASGETVALSTVRAFNQVKPGAPINVRVIDLDQSRTPGTNTVTVRVGATSGDRINALTLREVAPYTGSFEGILPTASAPATAFASDSEEGKEPNHVISRGEYPPWVALPDNQRPKIFTVDLNNNVALSKLTLLADVPGRRLRNFILQTSLNGNDFTDVATWPQPLAAWDGSLRLELARIGAPGSPPATLKEFRDYLEVGHIVAGAPKLTLPGVLSAKWDVNIGGHAAKLAVPANGWFVGRVSGTIYQPIRQTRTFRVDHKNQLRNVRYLLVVNGEAGRDPYEVTRSFGKGIHRVELYFAAQHGATPEFELLTDTPEPPYIAPAQPAQFDVTKFPADHEPIGFQPAQVLTNGVSGQFTVAFAPATRARVLRFWLVDFETDAPAIRKITLENAAGEVVLPPALDIVALRNNQTLEIVPGDRVTVTYEDPSPITKERQVQEAFLTATFHNAELSACFVESTVDGAGNRQPQYIPLRRFKPGDAVGVFIHDPDGDMSAAEDRAKFWAQVGKGTRIELEALETAAHSGVFVGRVFPVAGAAQRPGELTVGPGDDVVIGYLDQENTDPGIPWERQVVVEQTVETTPVLRVFETVSRPLTEAELATVARAAPARRVEEHVPVQRTISVLWPEVATPDKPATALIGTPLVVELVYPTIAQSPRSKTAIYVQTASARKLVAGPLTEPFDVTVPGTLKYEQTTGDAGGLAPPPGYRDVLVRPNPQSSGALEDGRFTFLVPAKLGPVPAAGAAETTELGTGAQRKLVPVLNVRGDDEVFIGFQYVTEAGVTNWLTRRARLERDVFFDAMDRRYLDPLKELHVGESVYFRLIDPGQDVTVDKDTVTVELVTSSGITNKVSLMETLPFSGVFKGMAALAFAADPTKPAEPGTVAVKYGDQVRARYAAPGTTTVVEQVVQVFKGASGNVLPFTKRFKDPEIAVQTQFTIAEAHFEMAKKHRELGQDDLARRQIAQGKKLLEESIRDYPNTEFRAQADYLLADLALEFANDAVEVDVKKKFYMEAVGRYSEIVASYPESTYAPKAQYKKALTYEKMGQIDEACEEYVKLSYRYPDNELVAETIARLGQYFLTKGRDMQERAKGETNLVEREKIVVQTREMYKTAAEVFGRLGVRFPDHKLAAKATVLSAQCYMRAEDYPKAITVFKRVIEEKKAEPDLMAQSMYWAGDCYLKQRDFVNAYRMFKRLTWDYPESQWAKFARGRLSEDALANVQEKDTTGGL